MQAATLMKYVKDPALLDRESVPALQQLVKDFPYFQPAHLLLSIAAKRWDSSVYQQSLKRTAIVVNNRSHLFELIHRYGEVETPAAEKITEPEIQEPPQTAGDATHELNVLKAAEVCVEQLGQENAKEETVVETPSNAVLSLPETLPAPEVVLEKEIGRQVVSAFIEKEVLKTPELHKPQAELPEPESFGDWLAFMKKNNGQPYQQIEARVNEDKAKQQSLKEEQAEPAEEIKTVTPPAPTDARKQKNKAIIDRIIEKNPGLIRTKEEQKFYAPDIKAKESLLENEHLVTETLARIYALQGSVNKAVRAYEILSLKYPQKSAYFATLIQKLKNNQ